MELIKRYVYAVTQKLPEQQRADIDKELTSLIEDMLDERVEGGPISERDIEEVLTELGDPALLAAKYRGKERYLISPERFDPYVAVVKVVIFSILIAISVASIVEFLMSPNEAVTQFADYLATLFFASIQGFAWVTIVFAWLDYKDLGSGSKRIRNNRWKPSDLQAIPDTKSVIKPSEPILGIIFSVIFLVLFTFALELVGVIRIHDGHSFVIPVFNTEEFGKYIPFIWIVTAIGILRDCLKMVTRKWNIQIVAVHLFFNITSLILMVVMLSNSSIWNPAFMSELVSAGLITEGSESYGVIANVWNQAREGLIYIIGLITLIDSVATGLKLYRRK
ncbi:HAAS signaling domain-containing protein [Paenibacillus dakarensis]|uniref:HAAS signaling domain-containing protein n=1 Tax=Paenibacillus dakarensis TaxID=1527293 RepID=UPI0006D576E0|nr:hypothetical protein [Paenibacillus dakarensis]